MRTVKQVLSPTHCLPTCSTDKTSRVTRRGCWKNHFPVWETASHKVLSHTRDCITTVQHCRPLPRYIFIGSAIIVALRCMIHASLTLFHITSCSLWVIKNPFQFDHMRTVEQAVTHSLVANVQCCLITRVRVWISAIIVVLLCGMHAFLTVVGPHELLGVGARKNPLPVRERPSKVLSPNGCLSACKPLDNTRPRVNIYNNCCTTV